ncbi:MAG: hypothetical protein JRI59_02305 [Deltaproteobacteria bacterium]|nr:hypothetical protein [Deltaproteobacteria bacterium]
MQVYTVGKLKQILGLGFAAGDTGVIETVESMCKTLQEIKSTLGLPPEAEGPQILEAIQALKAEKAPPKAPEKVSWFRALFKT